MSNKKYKISDLTIIDKYEYGYVLTKDKQAFYAIADEWKPLAGINQGKFQKWILVKRLSQKEKTKEELMKELLKQKEIVADLEFQIKNEKIDNRYEIMDL